MLSHDLLDAWAHIDSPVHRLDARVKLVCAFALIVAVLAVPVAQNRMLLVYAGTLLLIVAASRLPGAWLVKRMAIIAPFLALGTIGVAFLPPVDAGDTWRIGGLELSSQVVAVWASVGGKCALSLLIAVLLAGTSTSADLLRAAQSLRIPRTITALTGFAITYIAVLADEVGRMITAMRSRGRVRGARRRLATGAALLTTLMARTVERADRIALAMVSRGYRRQMPALAQEPVPAAQWAVGAAVVALALGLAWAGAGA
ncbi:MAG: cobalt ECF transporter T component CbiQ [Armatimonadota bacterium]|jgi:cobalt/nickel transport system permease protein